ncbi:MAG TPA: M1 family aminopeptidase, partial [Gemmatimonadales bacterium]|nr:M1 family aminopeptidase [Gemmatimonadales bacterium]
MAGLLLVVGGARATAQQPPAAAYLEPYRELMNLTPLAEQVADVAHLVLHRDAAQLTLDQGKLYLLSPVGGRTVAAVFIGTGRFTLSPTIPTEQAELQRFANAPALNDTITEAVFVFADSTADQLRGLTFGPGVVPDEVGDHARNLINSLKADHDPGFDASVMEPLLNGERSGLFLARLVRTHGDPVLFELDPAANEPMQLFRPVSRIQWGSNWAVVARFPLMDPLPGSGLEWEYRRRLDAPAYRLDVRLTSTGSANLAFAATAAVDLVPVESLGPWLLFDLHAKLTVDSARWTDGSAAPFFRVKDERDLWVRAPRRLAAGDSATLTLFYHGDLIDRYANWFFIDPSASWYPVNEQGGRVATFDITYHSPPYYPLASVGERRDSAVAGKVLTTRWVTTQPTDFATFNLGQFENYHVQQAGAPPLDILLSDEAHRALANEMRDAGYIPLPQQAHMRENVAADVSNSLKFFAYLFGNAPSSHFWVTEIPYGEGVSFPGMIDLSWATFQNTSLDGFDETFRAHEVAHQWWGNGVRQGSYRDKWLSEGLAQFSALWYLQTERKHNDEYFRYLDEYAADIHNDKDDAGPIWIGYRTASPRVERGYEVMIYEKGAWVYHMLRILMLDFGTMSEDRFKETLRDYYATYRGRPASTADFQQVVERHAGIPMNWFFDEWVRGTGIPTYHVAWKAEPAEDGKFRVRFHVTQEHVPATFLMFVPVSVDLG